MHLLPVDLGPLADVAGERTKYALAAVHLKTNDGGYRAEATDGKKLVIVDGTCPVSGEQEVSESLIPAPVWAKSFAAAKKLTKRAKPELRVVSVRQMPNETVLASTDLDTSTVDRPRNVDGRYPDTKDIIPPASDALATLSVNGYYLAELLKTVCDLLGNDGGPVKIELHKSHLVVRGVSESKCVTSLLMPLA